VDQLRALQFDARQQAAEAGSLPDRLGLAQRGGVGVAVGGDRQFPILEPRGVDVQGVVREVPQQRGVLVGEVDRPPQPAELRGDEPAGRREPVAVLDLCDPVPLEEALEGPPDRRAGGVDGLAELPAGRGPRLAERLEDGEPVAGAGEEVDRGERRVPVRFEGVGRGRK
jgi:hypothetical protein